MKISSLIWSFRWFDSSILGKTPIVSVLYNFILYIHPTFKLIAYGDIKMQKHGNIWHKISIKLIHSYGISTKLSSFEYLNFILSSCIGDLTENSEIEYFECIKNSDELLLSCQRYFATIITWPYKTVADSKKVRNSMSSIV